MSNSDESSWLSMYIKGSVLAMLDKLRLLLTRYGSNSGVEDRNLTLLELFIRLFWQQLQQQIVF